MGTLVSNDALAVPSLVENELCLNILETSWEESLVVANVGKLPKIAKLRTSFAT